MEAGFHSATLPSMAGAVGRLAAMEVKLKGVTAKTKPSSGRCSTRFHWPGEETGCCAKSCSANQGFQRKKSMVSAAESISACTTDFDCPSMVAALSVARHGPASRSAARRKTAARSLQGRAAQERRASRAASAAAVTSAGPAWWKRASTWRCRCGITISATRPVRTSRPPTTHGISMVSAARAASRSFSAARSVDPGT